MYTCMKQHVRLQMRKGYELFTSIYAMSNKCWMPEHQLSTMYQSNTKEEHYFQKNKDVHT